MRKKTIKKTETVFITGASAGVGRATALEFAAHGCRIALYCRGEKGLEAAKAGVESAGGKGLALTGDVADWNRLEWAADETERNFGPIDIWVNNAMTSVFSPFTGMTPEEFRRVTEVTYLGYVYGTMAALRRMKPRNKGKIVQVSSVLAHRSIPLQSAYCGAKHAINGFTESVRCELRHDKSKVDISEVVLPAVNTPQFDWSLNKMGQQAQPVPPIFQPETMAKGIYWASHHKRRELTIGGRAQVILWGNRFFPGLGDIYLGATGYKSQMTPEKKPPEKPANLWQPLDNDKDYGARGRFDKRAGKGSLHLWIMTHVGISWLTALGTAATGVLIRAALRPRIADDLK